MHGSLAVCMDVLSEERHTPIILWMAAAFLTSGTAPAAGWWHSLVSILRFRQMAGHCSSSACCSGPPLLPASSSGITELFMALNQGVLLMTGGAARVAAASAVLACRKEVCSCCAAGPALRGCKLAATLRQENTQQSGECRTCRAGRGLVGDSWLLAAVL